MGQWPGANINVVMEGALRAGLHGNRAWPHNTKRIYNVDPYYKTAKQIHNCLVRACLVMLSLSVTVNRTKKQNSKCRLLQVLVSSAVKSNHRSDSVADDWKHIYTGKLLLCQRDIIAPMSNEIKRKSKWNSSTFSPFLPILMSYISLKILLTRWRITLNMQM